MSKQNTTQRNVKRRLVGVAAATVLVIAGPACGSAFAATDQHRAPDTHWRCILLPWTC